MGAFNLILYLTTKGGLSFLRSVACTLGSCFWNTLLQHVLFYSLNLNMRLLVSSLCLTMLFDPTSLRASGAANVAVSCLTGTMKERASFSARSTTGPVLGSTATVARRPSPLDSLW